MSRCWDIGDRAYIPERGVLGTVVDLSSTDHVVVKPDHGQMVRVPLDGVLSLDDVSESCVIQKELGSTSQELRRAIRDLRYNLSLGLA